MDKKQIEAYVKQIADALTEEAMDYIVENGNETLISDEGLAKLFSKVVSYIDLKWNNNCFSPELVIQLL